MKFKDMVHNLNQKVAGSVVGRFFELEGRKSTFSTECRAGLTTFLAISYILAVNASILAQTGGTCTIEDCDDPSPFCKFPNSSGVTDPGYANCLEEVKRSLVTATAASSLVACFLMGAFANLPLALAPSMGINAYFTFTVVGFRGSGSITYQEALSAVFIEGWIFIILALTGVRGKLIQLVPKTIMLATAGGIGIFLAFIGLQASEGIGLVTYDSATLVALGGCPVQDRLYQYTVANSSAVCQPDSTGAIIANLGPQSSSYQCLSQGRMRSPTTWLGIAGGFVIVLLMSKNVRAPIVAGILFVTFISWIPNPGTNNAAAYLGANSNIEGGEARLEYFKKVVTAPDASKTAMSWSFSGLGRGEVWAALITFLYLDFLDCTGTLFSMASFINQTVPGFINNKKEFPRQVWAFCVDGVSIIVGSLLGTSPLTVYIESATGIKEGGRTGITALVVAVGFFIALFFTPLIASIPPYATGPALILVGAMMMENLAHIPWNDVTHAVPAFLTIAVMPLTYSIAYGVIAGIGAYLILYLFMLLWDICLMPITKKPLKDILKDATPEAFQDYSEELPMTKADADVPIKPQRFPDDVPAVTGPDATHVVAPGTGKVDLPADQVPTATGPTNAFK